MENRETSLFDRLRFTGTQVAYYFLCKRKLWLFSHGITHEKSSELVALGKVIDEFSFKREKRVEHYGETPVKVDFIRERGEIVVHEVKKSRKMEEVHEWQVKYYIYYLRRRGVDVRKGVIHYPRSLRIKEVILTKSDEKRIEEALREMSVILKMPEPPPPVNKPFCSKCAYYEFCFI